jgi:hypothetical protein
MLTRAPQGLRTVRTASCALPEAHGSLLRERQARHVHRTRTSRTYCVAHPRREDAAVRGRRPRQRSPLHGCGRRRDRAAPLRAARSTRPPALAGNEGVAAIAQRERERWRPMSRPSYGSAFGRLAGDHMPLGWRSRGPPRSAIAWLRLRQAPASLGKSAARAAPTGHTGLVFSSQVGVRLALSLSRSLSLALTR